MISTTDAVKNILNQSTTVKMIPGMRFEYNMNEYGEVITSATVSNFDGQNYAPVAGLPNSPFQKLFPIDTIKKPLRPESAGIKYAIVGDVPQDSWKSPKNLTYPLFYRTYYPGEDTYYKYWVGPKNQQIKVSIKYWANTAKTQKLTMPVNKIVAKFEIGHSIPSSWFIKLKLNSNQVGQTISSANLGAVNSATGVLNLYWTGTSWSTDESSLNRSSYVNCDEIEIVATPPSNKYLGLIELSPRYEIDISDRLVDFNILKEASSSSEDLVPVGKITSNSLTFSAISYEPSIIFKTFDSTALPINPSTIYLSQNLLIKPYVKIYNNSESTSFTEVKQGVFYLSEWSVSEYGDLSGTALDCAKILQETRPPRFLYSEFSSPGIIRAILDSIGFTNYNFNYKTSGDSSIITPDYWWTQEDESVWEAIEKLCRDSQMLACVDENNILQFYTREYLFDATRVASPFEFRYNADGNNLPNIIALNKKEKPTSRKITVIWTPAVTSEYDLSAQPIWTSKPDFLGAGALNITLPSTQTTGYITLVGVPISKDDFVGLIFGSYSGYFAIGQEIVEYDGVQYSYVDVNDGQTKYVDVFSASDFTRYKSLAKPGKEFFFPTGRFKIKTRGALGTTPQTHSVEGSVILSSWDSRSVTWSGYPGTSTTQDYIATVTGQMNQTVLPTDPFVVAQYEFYSKRRSSPTYIPPGGGRILQLDTLNETQAKNLIDTFAKAERVNKEPVTILSATMGKSQVTRSILSINNNVQNQNNSSMLIKNMDFQTTYTAAQELSIVDNGNGELVATTTAISANYEHFCFGTTLFFDNVSSAINQCGGIGFFTNNTGTTGYFVMVYNTKASLETNAKSLLKIVKVKDGVVSVIKDSQESPKFKVAGILAGEVYPIDIKVKKIYTISYPSGLYTKTHTGNQIIVYINGYKITANDTTSPISSTTNVSVFSNMGKTSFDYVYAGPMSQFDYEKTGSKNVYAGKYGMQTLSMIYGDKLVDPLQTKKQLVLEEFGPTAREIKKTKVLYNTSPAIPAYPTVGPNKFANILSSKVGNFGFEAYVINNAGTFVPLAGDTGINYIMMGKGISRENKVEYNTDPNNDYKNDVPIIFDSTWIQKESDAQELGNWIKNQWSEKQMTVDLQVFSNPLISVGDIIKINYPRVGFTDTMRFLVTNVSLSYREGLETSIVCRRILAS